MPNKVTFHNVTSLPTSPVEGGLYFVGSGKKTIYLGSREMSYALWSKTDTVGIVTVRAGAWSNLVQNITCSDLGANDHITLTPLSKADEQLANSCKFSVSPTTGQLTFLCETVPVSDVKFTYSIIHN